MKKNRLVYIQTNIFTYIQHQRTRHPLSQLQANHHRLLPQHKQKLRQQLQLEYEFMAPLPSSSPFRNQMHGAYGGYDLYISFGSVCRTHTNCMPVYFVHNVEYIPWIKYKYLYLQTSMEFGGSLRVMYLKFFGLFANIWI